MEDQLAKEQEMENTLFQLRLSHAEALAQKKKDQEKTIMKIMVDQDRIVNETDFKNQKKTLETKAKLELQLALKGEKTLTKAKKDQLKKEAAEKLNADLKNLEKHYAADKKYREKLEKQITNERKMELAKENSAALKTGLFGSGKTLSQRRDALRTAYTNDKGERDWSKGLSATLGALSDLTTQLDQQINSIAGRKSIIDTRLQGSKNKTRLGSY